LPKHSHIFHSVQDNFAPPEQRACLRGRGRVTWFSAHACLCLCLLVYSGVVAMAQVNIYTKSYNTSRTGANLEETILTPANVNSNSFGKLFTVPTDGQIYTQPLCVANLAIAGGTHNVIFVGSMFNTLYAIDADNGTVYWTQNFGSEIVAEDVQYNQNISWYTGVGILGTPVIDPNTNIMYFVSGSQPSDGAQSYTYYLNALEIATGLPVSGSPVNITATYSTPDLTAPLVFNPKMQNQRAGLALANGNVYICFGSHDDILPYTGWVMAYSESTLAQVAVYATATIGSGGGIWMAGQAPPIDSAGNLYFSTGNGSSGVTPNNLVQTGQSFIKLSPTLQLLDYFTPSNAATMSAGDMDLGSAGLLLLPNTSDVLGGGKQGVLYLVNTNDMGHFNASSDNVLEEFQAIYGLGTSHIHNAPVYFNSDLNGPTTYVWGENDVLRGFLFNTTTGLLNSTPFVTSTMTAPVTNNDGAMPGGFLSISANGNSNGILWASTPYNGSAEYANVQGVLYAFNADTLSPLWTDKTNDARDEIGLFAKNVAPVVANGKVYVPNFGPVGTTNGSGSLVVYGLLPVLTVAVTNATTTAGSALPTLTGTVTGLVNGDTLGTTIVVTYSTTATSCSPPGTYPITATVTGSSAGNYQVVVNAGTLAISPSTTPITITFPPVASRAYGSAPFAVTATSSAGSNSPVTIAVQSGPAVISGNIVTLTGAGAVMLQASSEGARNCSTVTATTNFQVTPAPLRVAVNNARRSYGAPNPAFSGTVFGAVGSDSFSESFTTTATATSNVGSYPIVPAVTGANLASYTITAVNGTLTVTPAPLTVAANNASRGYGAANPAFSGTVTGAVGSNSFNQSFTTTATATSNVGSYPIVPAVTWANLANYTVTAVNGTLTVTPAPLTVAASNATRSYGAANPAFSGTVTGAVGSDSFSESFTTTATASSNVGSYPIVPAVTGANLASYTVTAVNGALTVSSASTTTTLSAPASATSGSSVTLTATVASPGGAPSGSVAFRNGTTALGTGTLNSSGVATLSTTTLPVGNDSVTATYGAAGNFAGSNSAPVTLTVTAAPVAPPATYAMTANPTSLTVQEGQTATTTLTFAPTGGYNGTIALSCSSLPTNASCVFAQNQVTLNGNGQSVSLRLNIMTTQVADKHAPQSPLNPTLFALAFWWPGGLTGLAIFIRERILQKRQSSWQLCLLLVCAWAFAAGLSGCGFSSGTGSSSGTSTTPSAPAPAPTSSQITVVANGTSGTAVSTQNVILTLTMTQ
jgi:Bacterial Ig-like domain (group 3)/MBG domain (YGX type)